MDLTAHFTQDEYVNPALQILALLHAAKSWHADYVVSSRIVMFVPAHVMEQLEAEQPRQLAKRGADVDVQIAKISSLFRTLGKDIRGLNRTAAAVARRRARGRR